ncbi:NAD-dependent epimerase/dehydratase family protein [Kitasatospora cathayae]|uniref:NAD-dependent epimerase/dehydratase family protein n=1 Tax=Kitasatospora cathayae TaxID=3004092 RepID=A0ABY7Q672_9ACTN|nr:NAD-dependent epimerase/dehydratase family protein [Kitasatospora sp. HUAS 3-15]WBP88195.1 NAD-dependent epimerase/dehydratase family protein [Kitasatospora sp. HUAS 3-15]
MKILLLGGSSFLGRAYAAEALARGHQVTTFNRGRSAPDLPGVEAVRGDRDSAEDLVRLVEGRRWDAVVDTSAQQPAQAALSARLLRERADHYTFVSSVHAYADWATRMITEDSPLLPCPADAPPGLPFGRELKAGGERAVLEGFGAGRTLVLSSGLLIGPYERGGRLPWWLERMARGGRVLAPGDPGRTMQVIDVRDFAAFGLDLLTAGTAGRFLTTAPPGQLTFGQWLETCREVAGAAGTELVRVDDGPLLAEGPDQVTPWFELPFWAPDLPDWAYIWQVDSSRARAAGLRCRPFAETARDTWEWLRTRGSAEDTDTEGRKRAPGSQFTQGIEPAKEQRLLAAHG